MRPTRAFAIILAIVPYVAGCAFGGLSSSFGGAGDAGHAPDTSGSVPLNPPDAGSEVDASPDATPDAESFEDVVPVADTAPPDTGPRVTTPQCTLTLSTGIASCDSCLEKSCCASENACGQSRECLSLITCMDACGESPDAGPDPTSCFNACANQYPAGANVLNSLDSCVETSCASACPE